jgi:threonine dehydratase
MDLKPTLDDFQEARGALVGLVHRTPLFSSRSLSDRTGLEVWLKGENFQKTGSFKPRGVFNKVLHLSDAERRRGIITASAGNCGQAVAYPSFRRSRQRYLPPSPRRSHVSEIQEGA